MFLSVATPICHEVCQLKRGQTTFTKFLVDVSKKWALTIGEPSSGGRLTGSFLQYYTNNSFGTLITGRLIVGH